MPRQANLQSRQRLIVALDYGRLAPALEMAKKLAGVVQLFKIGKQLFTAEGPHAVQQIAALGVGVWLDLKFHDIPNTVAGAVAAGAALPGVRILNVHALGGLAMMKAARAALPNGPDRPALIAVTILTSTDHSEMKRVGISGTPAQRVLALARLAKRAGLDGVVASPQELRAIHKACGAGFMTCVQGVRPKWAARNDQKRIATPSEAIRDGAHYVGVGRPITQAADPRAAAEKIILEIEQALASLRSV